MVRPLGCVSPLLQAGTINIAPKKPNWDLKRDLEGKLTVLNKRTRRALRTLIRESSKQ